MAEEMIEAVFVARGKVQGINYRHHCAEVAARHKVTGYAKNLPDGSVEILACGEKGKLQDFANEIRLSRPEGGRVDELFEVSTKSRKVPPKSFERL